MSGAISEHFQNSELACRHCNVNGCTVALVEALESFRAKAVSAWQFGSPDQPFPGVVVHSAYRCAAHNASTPNAAKNSQHVQGLAADISVAGMTAAQLEAIARQVPAIKGIGRADKQAYLHIDVRETSAAWCYDAAGASVPYYAA